MRIAFFLFVFALGAGAQQRAPGSDTILRDQLKADLYFLAGDSMRGRLTGSPEYQLAAEWIESRFSRLGLKGAGGAGSFFHRFDLIRSSLAGGNALTLHGADGHRAGRVLEDFHPMIFSPSGEVRAAVAFAGYGIRAEALGWNDYARSNVRGSIALILDSEPAVDDPAGRFDGAVTSEYANPLRKVLWAQEAGARGVLIVNPRLARGLSFVNVSRAYWPAKPAHLERYTLATYANRIHIPAAQISPALARHLFDAATAGFDAAIEQAQAQPAAQPVLLGEATLKTSVERTIVEDRSVAAMIEGSDPQLKSEAVILSAHHDHNGAVDGQIFNGADDNGSGVVALVEIAEAYALAAAQGQRPRRSVLFISWGSEERCCGPLLGSWAWIEDGAWPLDKTAAVINMDMIGRSEEVPEGGGSRFNGLAVQTAASNANNVNLLGHSFSPDLSAAADAAGRHFDLALLKRYDNNKSNLLRRSDQWPFLQRGVPALFFHTGLHPDYHTVFDRPERIDYPKLERVARLVHQLSWDLANSASRPRYVPRKMPLP
ncbi:MAG: M28 family peptidase [Acidobacteria bacterium]|nr:M28 family peptidase [Acidobacteriota bacterium]